MDDEKLLGKLRRQYSKEETVVWIDKLCTERGHEIGFLKSELAEAKDTIKQQSNLIKQREKEIEGLKKGFKTVQSPERKKLKEENISKLLKEKNQLRNENISLKLKIERLEKGEPFILKTK